MKTVGFGPYKTRFFGGVPILYQFYLLKKLKEIELVNPDLYNYLVLKKDFIIRQCAFYNDIYKNKQLEIMEALCGDELRTRSIAAKQERKT